MVTWFFELTREVPRRRAFTSCMEVKIRRRWASRNEGADAEAAGGGVIVGLVAEIGASERGRNRPGRMAAPYALRFRLVTQWS